MTKAKEALANSSLDVPAALKWLQADLEAGGAAKAKKLAGRQASDGLIAVGVMGEGWGRRGGIVEVRVCAFFSLPLTYRQSNTVHHHERLTELLRAKLA
jgi:translation elongation factor EF-Ts